VLHTLALDQCKVLAQALEHTMHPPLVQSNQKLMALTRQWQVVAPGQMGGMDLVLAAHLQLGWGYWQ